MLAADTTPPTHVELRECPSAALYTRLSALASEQPALAFAFAQLLTSEAQRDLVLKRAFAAAIERQPDVAERNLAAVVDRRWATDAGFFTVLAFARAIAASQPEGARKLLIRAAQRYPDLALRESAAYAGLPFAKEVFRQAAVSAPDEAIGLASGNSVTGEAVREALAMSADPQLKVMADIAANESLAQPLRQRMGAFSQAIASRSMSLAQAGQLAAGSEYFGALAALRVNASGHTAAVLDRLLENYAEVLFRTMDTQAVHAGEPARLSPANLFLLLTYGRTEEDDQLFGTIFDRLLLPKLRAVRPAMIVAATKGINLRKFLALAADHHRLTVFLSCEASSRAQIGLLAEAMRGLSNTEKPLDEMIAAAKILEAVDGTAVAQPLRELIVSEYRQNEGNPAIYGLLAASTGRNTPAMQPGNETEFEKLATEYRPYLTEPQALNVAALFNGDGSMSQQVLFYDDEDASESFESFRRAYQHDATWKWEDREWYVHVSGSAGERTIDIYANVPLSVRPEGEPNRRQALARLLAEQNPRPVMLVHRGHTWYVPESLEHLNAGIRLVFLGSCRGVENVYAVVNSAPDAQMIATRGVGTQSINDPLLKALNDRLLRGENTLDWRQFWREQQARLGGNPMFRDYIFPPSNTAAILLAAYFAYVASGRKAPAI